MRLSPSLPISLLVVTAACLASSAPVPVRGDASLLAGQWVGEYESRAVGRAGSIVFTLEAGKDTAFGDVIMIPTEYRDQAGEPEGYPPFQREHRSRLITIAFVYAGNGVVAGRLDPYRDPECGCLLDTVFEGTLRGRVLEGTYRSHHQETGRVVEGTWRVERRE